MLWVGVMCRQQQGDNIRKRQEPCVFDIKFLSQNVRGLNDSFKRKKVFNNFKDKADIVFVQESHSTLNTEKIWKADWAGDIKYSHGTSAARGCMIMVKDSIDHSIDDCKVDQMGRYTMIKCNIQGQKMFLLNVYGPNNENEHNAFLGELSVSVKDFYDDDYYHMVFAGDWNFIENLSLIVQEY